MRRDGLTYTVRRAAEEAVSKNNLYFPAARIYVLSTVKAILQVLKCINNIESTILQMIRECNGVMVPPVLKS